MELKKLNQLAKSFVAVPIITLSLPFSGISGLPADLSAKQVRFNEKANIIALRIFDLNPVKEIETENKDKQTREIRAQAIDAYFEARNMPLAGYGMKMVLEAEKNDLDWRLLAGISVIETTGGKNLCKRLGELNNKNPFGWGSCKIGFKTFDEAIEIVAKNLGGNNPNTAHHYAEKDTEDILKTYNPPSVVHNYSERVIKVMNLIGTHDLGLSIADNIDNTEA